MPEIKSPQHLSPGPMPVVGHSTTRRQQSAGKMGSSLGSIVAGGALAVYGISRKSAGGAALAAAGSFLALRGIRHAGASEAVHVERSFTINRPVAEVFSFFRNFENLPKFMHHLLEVKTTGKRTSHWVARAPLGLKLEWDAQITEEMENRFLTWESLPGTAIPNWGAVEFRPASEYHGGTEIVVAMQYAPPVGKAGVLFARVLGREPGMQIREDLRRLKQLLETGEIPTTEGQAHGQRTAFARMMHAVREAPAPSRPQTEERPWAVGS